MQVCTSLQTDNCQYLTTSCHPTNSVKALRAKTLKALMMNNVIIIEIHVVSFAGLNCLIISTVNYCKLYATYNKI